MLSDGNYYDGGFKNHQRHGNGLCIYQNGEYYEG